MLTLNDGRSELWQWDTGRTLTVDAECSQVHFSNRVFGRSIDVDVVDGVAIIPDILLQTDKDLNVWAFVGTAENGYTKISKTFKVNRRNKPADYVFTPPDQTSLEEIKEKIDYLESIQDPDAIKNAVEDYLEQNPVEAPVQSVNGQTGEVKLTAGDVGAISQDDLQEATNGALAQAKASGEFDGADGKDGADGVSATHSWDGTKLTVTSASGTSSADLKGEKGEKGDKGDTGPAGPAGSGASSWNDLTDKPFGEEIIYGDTLTWDGNTDGLTNFQDYLYKVSDLTPSLEDLKRGGVITTDNSSIESVSFTEENLQSFGDIIQIIYDEYYLVHIALTDNAMLGFNEETMEPYVLSEKGIYFHKENTNNSHSDFNTLSLEINDYTFETTTIKQIDEKYLPSGAVILYADAENCLYATEDTSDTSKRITRAELLEAVMSGRQISILFVTETVSAFYQTQVIRDYNTYMIVMNFEGTSFFTAEYTAE